MEFWLLILGGLALGAAHTLEADHVAAVSGFVSRERGLKKYAMIGVLWGFGHTAALFLAGILVLALKINLASRVSQIFEIAVGIVLIVFGVNILLKIWQHKMHVHQHSHDGSTHIHLHSHESSEAHSHAHRSFFMGLLHGFAGSGALMLLILPTMPSVPEGLGFILIFGIGSVIGMLVMSLALGVAAVASEKIDKSNTILKTLAGSFSVIIGVHHIMEII